VSGTLGGSDPDAGQTLTYSIVTQPSQGTVTITNAATGTFTYAPNSGYAGSDSFTFNVSDGYKSSNTATESITINDMAPIAVGSSYQTKTGQALNGQLLASNLNAGQSLIFALVNKPTHGAVSINAASGTFTYTPTSGYAGADSFSFAANDGYLSSNTATVAITINDTAPTASNSNVTTAANTTADVTLSANDPDSGQTLAYSIVTRPAHGTLSPINANPGAYTYTPDSGFVGSDSFTFKVNDGYQDSGTATVTLTVNDNAPVAINHALTVSVNQNVSGVLDATDPDSGQTLTYSIVDNPLHGTVALTPDGSFIYAPARDFSGTDSFTFQANDGYPNSNVATESITVQNASKNSGGGSSGGGSFGFFGLIALGTIAALRSFCRRQFASGPA